MADYLLNCIRFWVEQFDIDGLRLDVAYCLDKGFLTRLRQFTQSIKPDFFLVGEVLHGDYNQWVNDQMCHSCTNYECYKGLYSSLNDLNLFEIAYSLKRQFGSEPWCLYQGKHLLSFVDNHDVTRAASILLDRNHLPLLYGLLFGMPGIPCIYYGSEWGAEGRKAPAATLTSALASPAGVESPHRPNCRHGESPAEEPGSMPRGLSGSAAHQPAIYLPAAGGGRAGAGGGQRRQPPLHRPF